jgi:hypothetical protein
MHVYKLVQLLSNFLAWLTNHKHDCYLNLNISLFSAYLIVSLILLVIYVLS